MKKIGLEKLGVKLIYKPLGKKKGYFDLGTGELAINSKIPKRYQDSTLIHEILHATAEMMVQMKIIKKHPDHKFIGNCAQQLLIMFALAGKWKGLSKKDLYLLTKHIH